MKPAIVLSVTEIVGMPGTASEGTFYCAALLGRHGLGNENFAMYLLACELESDFINGFFTGEV